VRSRYRQITIGIHLGVVAGSFVFGCGELHSIDAESKPDGLVGTVRSLIVSYGDHAESFDRLVGDDGEEISLDFRHVPRRARVGDRIFARGARDGNRIEVSGFDVLSATDNEVQQPPSIAPHRTIRLAVLLLTPEITKETLARRVFTDPDSPAALYRENSYGAWTLEGDVFGPYTIATTSCRQSVFYVIAEEAAAAAAPDGFDPAAYDNLLYYIGERTTGCNFAAAAEVGINVVRGFFNAKYSWYREAGCVALAQELGHNFGLLHAHECAEPPYTIRTPDSGACQGFNEYGDKYTPMGGGCGHLNAPESAALEFISGCNTLDVTSSGTFEIGPIEAKCSGPQVIRISARATANYGAQYIYVEYRRGVGSVGSDRLSPQGIYFHASAEYGGNPTGIDSGNRHNMDYALDPFQIHEPLTTVDSAWTEPSSGARFKLTAMGDTATVEVVIPEGGGGAVRCIDGSPSPSSPLCSPIAMDAGARDSGQPDILLDAGTDTDDSRDASIDAVDGGVRTLDLPAYGTVDSGCDCSVPGAPTPPRTSPAVLGLMALIAAHRRRRTQTDRNQPVDGLPVLTTS
jgi:MYXO-CTERM domain-containing protein